MIKINPVILAAGKGTRMYSDLPKVLHQIGGKSMLNHVLEKVNSLNIEPPIVVYGHGKEQVETILNQTSTKKVYQEQQLGTAHAVLQALPQIEDEQLVLILYADTPLISVQTLKQLIAIYPENGIALLTVTLDDPTGYGRILRNEKNEVMAIIEQKEASIDVQQIKEINTGILIAKAKQLKNWLNEIDNNNAQNEYYLTDIIKIAYQQHCSIKTTQPQENFEVEGVNNRLQLTTLERQYQKQQVQRLSLAGVGFSDPNRFDLRGSLTCGKDVNIDINVIIEGHVELGNHVEIGAGAILKNCKVADYSIIKPYSIIEDSIIGANCSIGPFSRIRPQTHLKEGVHVGNFVELKKVELGENTKAGHLTYLGDSVIGKNVNVGAGTITCNYDGANKWQTIVEDDVFIGSDSQLVAPIKIEKGATIGAGTTVTKTVLENQLAISRSRQQTLSNWKRPIKIK